MKVLWITPILMPEAESLLNGSSDFKSSGGWIVGAADALSKISNVQLHVATITPIVKEYTVKNGANIVYHIIPSSINDSAKGFKDITVLSYFKKIAEDITPDIVHIHGTELSYSLSYIKEIGSDNVVVSIQGVISEIAKYYTHGLNYCDILGSITLRDIISKSVIGEKNNFIKRGQNEIEIIKSVRHIIGRTSFDRAHAWAINPYAKYHFCNESLRSEFYSGQWLYSKCNAHTIFLSQASYPIKGLHQFLKALPLVIKHYPDTKVFIAGYDITRRNESFLRRLLVPGYGRYLSKIINKYELDNVVSFTGPLNAHEMKEQLLRSNIFVCPSSIENSPNSLGEAQILGVPCIASYAGGIPDMIPNEKCGILYRYEDVEMLAKSICDVFSTSHDFDNTEMILTAQKRHNQSINTNNLVDIYNVIISEL